jgi:hypothetical protein
MSITTMAMHIAPGTILSGCVSTTH